MADKDSRLHWLGIFKVIDTEISGEITYDKNSGDIVLNLERAYSASLLDQQSFGNPEIITGRLQTGATVILFHNSCIYNTVHVPNFQRIGYSIKYMIFAGEEVYCPKFNALVFTLENALAWSELTCFDEDFIYGIKIKNNTPVKTVKWFGSNITFSPHLNSWNHYPRKEEINIIQRLEVRIESDSKEPIEHFIDIRNKIISLISFAIKGNVNIENQQCIDSDAFYYLTDIKQFDRYDLFTSESKKTINKLNPFRYNFTLSELDENDDLEEYISKLTPVFNLYLSLFKYNDMPEEMVFLNIVQAIETFHSRFFYNNDVKEYVKSVKERYQSSTNFDAIKQLLLSRGQDSERCKSIFLVSRINDLFLNSRVSLFKHYCVGNNKAYAQRIVDTRNYLTHYDPKKESKALCGRELSQAIYVLKLLLEYNICIILGIDNKEKVQDELADFERSKYVDEYLSRDLFIQ